MVKRRVGKRVSTRRKVARRKVVRRRVVRRKPISRKIIGVFRNEVVREALSAILIIAILYFGIQGTIFLILRTDSPMMAVVSNSMKPTFERGDLIFVKGVDSPDQIMQGDIIVFQFQGDSETKVHRVVEIVTQDNELQFRTKGDNPITNPTPDSRLVKFEEVKGKAIFWIPKLGYISLWIRGE